MPKFIRDNLNKDAVVLNPIWESLIWMKLKSTPFILAMSSPLQVMQKVEGNITFHTALSTAFPQPAPGTAPSPGPMKVPTEQLRNMLGLSHVNFVQGTHSLALLDSTPA